MMGRMLVKISHFPKKTICSLHRLFQLQDQRQMCPHNLSIHSLFSRTMKSYSLFSIDINECLLGTFECHSSQTCSNTPGNYTCTCTTGQTFKDGMCQGMVLQPNYPKKIMANLFYCTAVLCHKFHGIGMM